MGQGRRLALLGLGSSVSLATQSARAGSSELMDLILEELAEYRITSVARHDAVIGRRAAAPPT